MVGKNSKGIIPLDGTADFESRAAAVKTAKGLGLGVSDDGAVSVPQNEYDDKERSVVETFYDSIISQCLLSDDGDGNAFAFVEFGSIPDNDPRKQALLKTARFFVIQMAKLREGTES